MSVTIEVDLPEPLASEAKAKGLLDPKRLANLIKRELRAGEDQRNFFDIIREIQAQPGDPLSMEEIQAEVDVLRARRRAGEAGR
jgi:hypothetical protein